MNNAEEDHLLKIGELEDNPDVSAVSTKIKLGEEGINHHLTRSN